MIKVMLVGGTKTDAIIDTLGETTYSISSWFNFIEDAFNAVMENSGEYLDTNVILVLQYGFKNGVEILEQMRSLQEALVVCGMSAELYFVLKDIEKYEECKGSEDLLVYNKTRIIYLSKIQVADITRIVQGELDKEGLYREDVEVEESYTEDVFSGEEKGIKHFTNVGADEPEGEPEEDDIKDEGEGTKKGFFLKMGKKARKAEVKGGLVSGGDTPDIYFRGVIAVTGDRNMGVSSTAANIAEYFAGNNRTVLLVDMDLKRKALSILYPDLAKERKRFTNTQLGVLTVLNNPDMIEDVMVVVKDNLAFIGSSREPEFAVRDFANKPLDKVVSEANIIKFLGVAKGLFDIVVIDYPMEALEKSLQASIIVDKFLACVENTLYAVDNLFKVCFAGLLDVNEAIAKSVMDKTDIVLTKFTEGSTYRGYVIDEGIIEEYIRGNVYDRIKVLGHIGYRGAFYRQETGNKRAIDLDGVIFEQIKGIVDKIY